MDIKHYYIESGQGEPMILLHGNGENCDHFIANKKPEEFNRAVLDFLEEP